MNKIAIFYGSTTGSTEEIAERMAKTLGIKAYNISESSLEEIEEYTCLILGSSTWGYGELQDDWSGFFEMNGFPNFSNKKVAIFGLGDQEDHYDVFVNAIGILHEICKNRGAIMCGYSSTQGYSFGKNTSAVKDNMFLGLALDVVNQNHLTNERVSKWLEQILKEFQ